MNIQFETIKEKTISVGKRLKELAGTGIEKFKGLPKKKKIIVCTIAVLAVLLLIVLFGKAGGKKNEIQTAVADRGNISVVISGTGTIKPIDEYEVTSLVKGEILSDTFQEGDMVEKGDLLYQIDSSDLENTLEKAQLNHQKTQLSYNQTMRDLAKLNVKSTYSGTITETYVKVGDSVNIGTKIADLVDMRTMRLELPFNESDVSGIYVGSSAQVTLANSLYTLTGKVTRISSGSWFQQQVLRLKPLK